MQASLAVLPAAHWTLMCGYAAAHLLAMYLATVAVLPGLRADEAVPPHARHILQVRCLVRRLLVIIIKSLCLLCKTTSPRVAGVDAPPGSLDYLYWFYIWAF